MDILLGAKEIIDTLNKANFEAYIVGGYVRDYLLKRQSSDIDIATNALPEEVIHLFKKTINTGLKHGTITVMHRDFSFEVTTFREDSVYIEHRKPESVTFIKSLKEDVLRRDFTMNALALTKDEKIIDYVQGQDDIKNKIINTVGDPYTRFNEDALRMLRAFRFVSTLGFTIEERSRLAIKENARLIKNVSLERVMSEFEKMIKGDHFCAAIKEMVKTEIHDTIPYFKNGLECIVQSNFKPNDFIEFLAMCAVCDSYDQIENLPIPNYIKKETKTIYNMFEVEIKEFNKPLLFRNSLKTCLVVNKLNVLLRNEPDKSSQIIDTYHQLPIRKQCDLKFKGDHIIEFYNRAAGGWISEILDDICLKVIMGELENNYDVIKHYLTMKENKE